MAKPLIPLHDTVRPRLSTDQDLRGRDGPYVAEPALLESANVAMTLGLPLLLTGEPGCGKTDFAYVAANALAEVDPGMRDIAMPESADEALREVLDPSRPLECQIRSNSRARDLLYHYDALLRFTEAQHGGDAGRRRAEDARHYIELQGLGIALTSPIRRVVLLDEIDKAPRDLPNDLLRELDRGTFEIVEIAPSARSGADAPDTDKTVVRDRTGARLQRLMRHPHKQLLPLVVITSNVERQLPDPFLRRCVFFHIPFPDKRRLREIVGKRFPERDPLHLDWTVHIFEKARKIRNLSKRPSTAELLDWVQAQAMFEHRAVHDRLREFHEVVGERGRLEEPGWSWTDLPAVGCLFKLHEDLQTVARLGA